MYTMFNLPPHVCEQFRQELQRVKEKFGAMDHIVRICEDDSLLGTSADEVLQACGLTDYRVIRPRLHRNQEVSKGLLGGWCYPLHGKDYPLSLILLRTTYPAECTEGFVATLRLHSLYHELGHADHFKKGLYIDNHNARKAEKYADDFVRRHLKAVKVSLNDGHRTYNDLWQFLAAMGARDHRRVFPKPS
jgi:hypothetical protein